MGKKQKEKQRRKEEAEAAESSAKKLQEEKEQKEQKEEEEQKLKDSEQEKLTQKKKDDKDSKNNEDEKIVAEAAAAVTNKSKSAKKSKKSKKAISAPASAAQKEVKLNDDLARAEIAVMRNKETVENLHKQWRVHLLRLAFLVFMITLHQTMKPMSTCISDIKNFNELSESAFEKMNVSNPRVTANVVTGLQAMRFVAGEITMELLCILMAGLLTYFLNCMVYNNLRHNNPEDYLANLSYICPTTLTFPIISFYFKVQENKAVKELGRKLLSDATLGRQSNSCIAHLYKSNRFDHPFRSEEDGKLHAFPVILIFHIIVTGAIIFMNVQRSQHDRNILMIHNLKMNMITTNASNMTKNAPAGTKQLENGDGDVVPKLKQEVDKTGAEKPKMKTSKRGKKKKVA